MVTVKEQPGPAAILGDGSGSWGEPACALSLALGRAGAVAWLCPPGGVRASGGVRARCAATRWACAPPQASLGEAFQQGGRTTGWQGRRPPRPSARRPRPSTGPVFPLNPGRPGHFARAQVRRAPVRPAGGRRRTGGNEGLCAAARRDSVMDHQSASQRDLAGTSSPPSGVARWPLTSRAGLGPCPTISAWPWSAWMAGWRWWATPHASIQSISKLCLGDGPALGGGQPVAAGGLRGPGTPFNSLIQLESEQGKPRNPLHQRGALVVTDILCSRHLKP